MKITRIIGNIGSGKSTLLNKIFRENPQKFYVGNEFRIIEEPVEENPILPLFYKSPSLYAFAMQTFMQGYFYNRVLKCIDEDIQNVFTDYGLTEIFTEVLHKNNMLTETEYKAIMLMCDILQHSVVETEYIYIETSPSVCLERINSRGRECEKNITLEYLNDLHFYYQKFVAENKNKVKIYEN